ncbi:hypothetical protein Mgra_00008495 [Meloidogyne graminicola]|uniref:Uncharacterized protein n=1 Tax=Meloidogyne graminicola TaxID=189291 RepID=A0A8S9ZFM8_9BILA|nr:hypothetical protein Mgra_00008495 [Meloidogyne graminicola]
MTNICHSTSSSTNISISLRSLLLFCIALLLVGGKVHCANLGLGKHTVDIANGKVTKIKEDWSIIKPGEDLTGLKGVQDACDGVTFEGEQIKVWYKKGSKAAENGCILDLLVTTKSDSFILNVGAYHPKNLGKCLGQHLYFFPNENLLPFTYSLREDEFEYIRKNGPKKGKEGCDYIKMCQIYTKGEANCMEVADWMLGIAENEKGRIFNFIKQIDEPGGWWCRSWVNHFTNDSSFQIKINDETKWETVNEDYLEGSCSIDLDGMDFNDKKRHAACYQLKKGKNNLRKVGRWEITDPDFIENLKELKYYNHIITFYMLPQKSARKQNMTFTGVVFQNVLSEPLDGPECDMYIKFPSTYRLIGPATVLTTTNDQHLKNLLRKPPIPIKEPEKSGSSVVFILIIGVVIFLLLLPSVGILIWFVACRKSNAEEEIIDPYFEAATIAGKTTKTKTMANTTVGSTQTKTKGGKTTVVPTVVETQAVGGTVTEETAMERTGTKDGTATKDGVSTLGGSIYPVFKDEKGGGTSTDN